MSEDFDNARRNFLRAAVATAAAVPAAGLGLYAASRPALAEDLPQAEDGHAHDYVNDVADTDHDAYEDGQLCENCTFWTGEEEDGWGGCQHPDFMDVLVAAEGWCSAYAPAA